MTKRVLKSDIAPSLPHPPFAPEEFDGFSGADQDRAIDRTILAAQTGTAEQRAFFERRRQAGLGIGLDARGRLISQEPSTD